MKRWWVTAAIAVCGGVGLLLWVTKPSPDAPAAVAGPATSTVTKTTLTVPQVVETTNTTTSTIVELPDDCGLGDPLVGGERAPSVFSVGFDDQDLQGFDDGFGPELEQAFGRDFEYLSNADGLAIVEQDGNKTLQQRYVPNHRGSAVTEFLTESGSVDGSDEMWLSYRVLFEPGWEWVKGGKLPGLAGGDYPSGGGGADGTDGFSARLMWRPDGQIVVYAYHPDRPSRFGEDFPLCSDVAIGQWVQITQRVVMNTSADAFDGLVEVWIDGEKRLRRDDIRWRTAGDFKVDRFVYSSFFGGSTSDWSPSRTVFAQFDDFRMSKSRLG